MPRGSESSLLELPLLPAHGAEVLGLLRVEPLHDAVDVEAMGALREGGMMKESRGVEKNLLLFPMGFVLIVLSTLQWM